MLLSFYIYILQVNLTYDLSPHYTVFSKEGIEDLQKQLQSRAGEGNFMSLFVCEPYTFLIGCISGKVFAVDTHPVVVSDNGRMTGMIVFTDGHEPRHVNAVTKSLHKRLFQAGVDTSSKQTLSTIFDARRYVHDMSCNVFFPILQCFLSSQGTNCLPSREISLGQKNLTRFFRAKGSLWIFN